MHRQRKKLTKEQVSELQIAQANSPNVSSALRFQAVRLYGMDYPVKEIMTICGCSRPSLMEWNRHYHQGGVARLIDQRQGGNHTLLCAEQIEHIQRLLHQYQPNQLFSRQQYEGEGRFWGIATLALLVEKEYAVRYKSASSYRQLFEKCDFSYQRTGHQYLSRSELKVVAFEEMLEKN
jgi:transposase